MDPFSADSELLNLHNAFHQGQYDVATTFDVSSLSASNALPARVLMLRAQIAQGDAKTVLSEVKSGKEPELLAVKALALWQAGEEAKGLELAEQLAAREQGNGTVQVLSGTVLTAAGKNEEALALLGLQEGNLEAVALTVQIHLLQNRLDLAIKEVTAARKWAQDSLLVNLAESWVGLRVGGEKYQQAFYVFEELAQAASTSSNQSLVSQAVAEMHLGRLEEAEAALKQALEKDQADANAIANLLVLTVVAGKDASEFVNNLTITAPTHPFLADVEEKSALFDKAATKYSAKVA